METSTEGEEGGCRRQIENLHVAFGIIFLTPLILLKNEKMPATQDDHFRIFYKTPSELVFLIIKSGTIPMYFLGRGPPILYSVGSDSVVKFHKAFSGGGFGRILEV